MNLHRYPWGEAHEDFVAGVEDPASRLGWTAVVRPTEGDLFLSLQERPRAADDDAVAFERRARLRALERAARGCLGVEEGAALPVLGLSSRETPDPLTAAGQPAC